MRAARPGRACASEVRREGPPGGEQGGGEGGGVAQHRASIHQTQDIHQTSRTINPPTSRSDSGARSGPSVNTYPVIMLPLDSMPRFQPGSHGRKTAAHRANVRTFFFARAFSGSKSLEKCNQKVMRFDVCFFLRAPTSKRSRPRARGGGGRSGPRAPSHGTRNRRTGFDPHHLESFDERILRRCVLKCFLPRKIAGEAAARAAARARVGWGEGGGAGAAAPQLRTAPPPP